MERRAFSFLRNESNSSLSPNESTQCDATFGNKSRNYPTNEISNFHTTNRAKKSWSSQQIGQSLFAPESVAFICPYFIFLQIHLSSIFFVFFYNTFPSLRNHPFHYTSPPFSPLSRLVSLKFPSGLQQPFLSFFSFTVSSPLAVYLVIFSYFSLPPLFPVYDPSFLFFYFFSPSDFPPRRTLFSPSSPLPLHFWPVYGGLIRDFDAETWKSSIETNRLRGPLCVGIGVRHG